jgi:hypothetical protein
MAVAMELPRASMVAAAAQAESERMRGGEPKGRVLGLSRRASRTSWHACEQVRGHAVAASSARLATHVAMPIQKLKN